MNNKKEIAFLFDLDGTLLDAIPFFNQLVLESIKEMGIKLDKNLKKTLLFNAINQTPDKSSRDFIFNLFFTIGKMIGVTEKSKVYKLQVNAGMKYLKGMKDVDLIEGTPETLHFLNSKGYKLGLVTTSSNKDLAPKLGDLMELFDVICAREDTKKMKPNPEPILKATEDLNIAPNMCVMIGDTPDDILAGKNAKVGCTIGVLTGFSSLEIFKEYNTDLILNSIAEIPTKLPDILNFLTVFGICFGIAFGIGIIIFVISILEGRKYEKRKKPIRRNFFGAEWLNANLSYKNIAKPTLEKEINQYITLKLEYGRTFIYVNGKKFIQCIRLVLNIPKNDVPQYDEIESIDEAAEVYDNHLFHNRIIGARLPIPLPNQGYTITPEQEFWGHCSNIQAWVEHDYDTRILMRNISFPLLRELTKAGDPKAKRIYKEEIALRLESGYPSVVQYLLAQGYLNVFSSEEFRLILETSDLIKNLSSNRRIFSQFIRKIVSKFPVLSADIIVQTLNLPDGKNIFISSIQAEPRIYPYRSQFKDSNYQFLNIIKKTLKKLIHIADENKLADILECIQAIKDRLKNEPSDMGYLSRKSGNLYLEAIRNLILDNVALDEKQEVDIDQMFLKQHKHATSKCAYCGKLIPKDQDVCEWCGHKK
ncbi:MAG: HAD family hydrolase, partial [Promethearchaeota archaeon]